MSHEHTFDVDTSDPEVLERTLLALSEGVAGRLRSGHVLAHTIAVKVRDDAFVTTTRQRTVSEPTDETDVVFQTALDLARPQLRGTKVRLLGVAASHLDDAQQLRLFVEADPRRRRATEAADAIRRRFGATAIRRARLLGSGVAEPFERDPRQSPERGIGHSRRRDGPDPS